MPRLVKIPDCTYELFAKIRGVLLDHAPWALRNDIYENETNTAFLFFEDSAYIPFRLQAFILSPPFDQGKINAALANVDEDLLLIRETKEEDTVTSISHSDLIDLLTEESDKQFKESLEKLPPKIREKLSLWRSKKEAKK